MTDVLDSILLNLRVPQLHYTLGGGHQYDSVAEKQLVAELTDLGCDKSEALIPWYRSAYKSKPLRPIVVNSLFLADRLFDSYFRKNQFSELLCRVCNKWRYLIAFILIRAKNKSAFTQNLLKIIDVFMANQVGLHVSKGAGVQQLDKAISAMNTVFFSDSLYQSEALVGLLDLMRDEARKQEERREKLLARLLETENGAARLEEAVVRSEHLVYRSAGNRYLPAVVRSLLTDVLQPEIRHWIVRGGDSVWVDQMSVLIEDLVRLLSSNTQDAEKLGSAPDFSDKAPELIDRIEQMLEPTNADSGVVSSHLSELQRIVIGLFQGEKPELVAFPARSEPAAEADDKLEKTHPEYQRVMELVHARTWLRDVKTDARFQLMGPLGVTRRFLLVNHVGAKHGSALLEEVGKALTSGQWKPLPAYQSLASLFDETVRGLAKVSEAQFQQRQRALEKAKAEAKALREAREKAEKAQKEQLERLRKEAEQKQKADAERTRLELEQKFLSELEKVTLGAWMEYTRDGKREKGKLAIKTTSTNKWIFVDRHGLNRFEIQKEALIEQLIRGEAKILNSGMEFDESLERTVSRIRMAKK